MVTLILLAGLSHACGGPETTPSASRAQRLITVDPTLTMTLAEIGSAGSPSEDAVRVDIDGDVRIALPRSPGAVFERELDLPAGALLRAAVSGVATEPIGFSILLEAGGEREEVFSRLLEPAPGRWEEIEVSLDRWAGDRVRLTLRTDSDDPAAMGLWGNPLIVTTVGPSRATPPHVVLISVDTLRADHLSLYGYERPTSPHLDAWAQERGIVFDHAFAQSPWTLPSHVSLFTGLEAFRHGVNHEAPAPTSLTMLPEVLRDAGYLTFAVIGGGWLRPQFGLAQGFDEVHYWNGTWKAAAELSQGVAKATELLRRYGGVPVFLFFHTFEPHDPYQVRQPFFSRLSGLGEDADFIEGLEVLLRQRPVTPERGFEVRKEAALVHRVERVGADLPPELARLPIDLYDSSIGFVDEEVGKLLTNLRDQRLEDRTLVVFTSDHGELLGEHGVAGHAYLWEENLRIPLVLAYPDGRHGGRRVEAQARSIDVLPTILEAVGLEPAPGIDGQPLRPVIEGVAAPREAWAYAGKPNPGLSLRRDNRLKYIFVNRVWPPLRGREALFDLRADPGEQADLAVAEHQLVDTIRQRAEQLLLRRPAGPRLRLTNSSPTPLVGRLRGSMIDQLTVKAVHPEAPGLEWLGPGAASFHLPAGADLTLYFETATGESMGIFVEGVAPIPPSEIRATFDGAFEPRSVTLVGGQWVDTIAGAGATEGSITIGLWLEGELAPESSATIDEDLRRQLEALGYLQ